MPTLQREIWEFLDKNRNDAAIILHYLYDVKVEEDITNELTGRFIMDLITEGFEVQLTRAMATRDAEGKE